MSIAESEAQAFLRILVAVARVDGTVHHDERKSLAAALESLELPGGIGIDALLAADVDLDEELGKLVTEEAREQVYRSAFFMAHADGQYDPKEAVLLAKIATSMNVSDDVKSALERLFPPEEEAPVSSFGAAPITDPAERDAAVQSRVFKCSVLAAGLGAFPIPGLAIATDLAVVALQLKMIRDVGAYYGHRVDRAAAKSLLLGVGLGTGARLAVANLAKLLPGWGSVVGATSSFVSTYALGKVMSSFFASGKQEAPAPDALRARFVATEAEARKIYADQADVIIQSQRSNRSELEALAFQLRAGSLSQHDFDSKVAALL